MDGLHLTADLRGCDPALPAMTQTDALREHCISAVHEAGLLPVGELFHRFPAPGGVTGMVLLAESHLAVHTWPESGSVTLDVYVCNRGTDNSLRARRLLDRMVLTFGASDVREQSLRRGDELPSRQAEPA
jgi:S-adenosylmethionine decarboxylase